MKKKFIFTVLVILAFGLSIGCANTTTSAQVPIEYMITNNYSDGTDISVRICEMGWLRQEGNEWEYEIFQVLTSPQYIENGKTKTFVVDVKDCMEYNFLYIEASWFKGDKYAGSGWVAFDNINYTLTELDGKIEHELSGTW